jgi:N-acetylmuramoyl-L-alanine amidase
MSIENALLCLALNVYHEARGETVEGQVAVAMVTMNRAGWDTRNVCPTVYKPRQFSWTHRDAQPPGETVAWRQAKTVAQRVIAGKHKDNTQGATHFHARSARPVWRHSLQRTTVIGQHVFYRPE